MSTLPDSSEITPGQCSFWSLNITVNSILPAGNESFLLCVRNHSAPIFSLFEVQTVCGLGIHLTLRPSLHLKTLLVKSWELQGQKPHREKKKRAGRKNLISPTTSKSNSFTSSLCSENGMNAEIQLSIKQQRLGSLEASREQEKACKKTFGPPRAMIVLRGISVLPRWDLVLSSQ